MPPLERRDITADLEQVYSGRRQRFTSPCSNIFRDQGYEERFAYDPGRLMDRVLRIAAKLATTFEGVLKLFNTEHTESSLCAYLSKGFAGRGQRLQLRLAAVSPCFSLWKYSAGASPITLGRIFGLFEWI